MGSFPLRRAAVIASRLRHADLLTRHAYLLKPGQPTPGLHNFLRPHIASLPGTGILTCFPSATLFSLALGADSPCADERGAGNLGLAACGLFTRINATHVSIRTSDISREPHDSPSQTYRTLPYHRMACAMDPQLRQIALAPLNLPRRTTRSVSYYAFFKWWLLLSQHPDCLCLTT